MKKVVTPKGLEFGKETFESIVNTVKRKETFVPIEQIFKVKNLPKESEIYYIMQSKYELP